MKNIIKAVLLDLDGVIVFTDKYHYLGWKRLADEQGWEFDETINHKCRGVSRMASLQVILDHNNVNLPEAEKIVLADRKNVYYIELLEQIGGDDLYPGAVEFLKALKAGDVKLALCSASKNAVMVLERLGLADFFDAVVTGYDITKTKPDPEIFLLAAERLNVPPQHCLVFEDAASGVEAAHRGGMKCIGVGTPDRLPEALETMVGYDEIDVDAMLESGHKKRIQAEPWAVAETGINPKRAGHWESLFALTNGYMGVRGTYDEDEPQLASRSAPGTFINSIYDYLPYHHLVAWKGLPTRWHAMANIGHWTTINLEVEGERFSLFSGKVSDYRRELDLRNGVVRSSLTWESPGGKRVRIESARLVSMVRRHSAAVRYEVIPLNFSGSVMLESVIEGKHRGNVFPDCATEIVDKGSIEDRHYFLTRTGESAFTIGMAFGHKLSAPGEAERTALFADDTLIYTLNVQAAQGEKVILEKHACFYTSFEEAAEDVLSPALAGVGADLGDGFDRLYEEQSAFWKGFWETADIEIGGNTADQQAVRFTLFHLRQSHPEDDRRSISATGMTSDGYWGHVFWDAELYISPMFNYTQPELVRSLLMYRYNILDKAREHAAEMDGVGALWAWNSINGEECGVIYEAATAQYHINPDVIYAVWRYYMQTGDTDFMYRCGAEILFETARFLADRGKFIPERDNKFCINVVCGPDEYGCAVDNNCYTNMMAQFHLDFAAGIYKEMGEKRPDLLAALKEKIHLTDDEPEMWKRAADNMYIPFDERLGIHKQDDSFLYRDPVDMTKIPLYTDIRWHYHPLNLWRMQVAKQADVVLLMFTLGDRFSKEVKRANYEYYEPRTNHGSSLSPAIHSIAAAEIGRVEEAYDYFRLSAHMDLSDFKNNASNGVHAACLGGAWMAVINGMAGMRDYEDRLIFNPVLPEAWEYYRFKVHYRGRLIGVDVRKGKVTYELLSGEPVSFHSGGREIALSREAPRAVVEP